jgi:hypothetical protein
VFFSQKGFEIFETVRLRPVDGRPVVRRRYVNFLPLRVSDGQKGESKNKKFVILLKYIRVDHDLIVVRCYYH